MTLLNILIAPHPLLKQKAKPVAAVDDRVRKLLDDMLFTMYEAKGIGLAAPQVGILERIVVIDIHEKDEPPKPMKLVNPEIIWESPERSVYEEGCLSVPEQYADVVRPTAIKLRYLDENGASHEIAADGMLATCLQHELDHLEGTLFVDHLSMLKRNMILRKVQKARKTGT
jgi:peptide deformylase